MTTATNSTQIKYFFVHGDKRARVTPDVATSDQALRDTYSLLNADWANPDLFDVHRRTVDDGVEISFVPAGTLVSEAPPATEDETHAATAPDVDDASLPDSDTHEPDATGELAGTTQAASPVETSAAEGDVGASALPSADTAPRNGKKCEPTVKVTADGEAYDIPASHCSTDRGLLTSLASHDDKFEQHTLWTVERAGTARADDVRAGHARADGVRGDGIRVVPVKVSKYWLELSGNRHELAPEIASVDAHLRAFIAEAAPRMADAQIERTVTNGEMVIRLVKLAGTKGAGSRAAVRVAHTRSSRMHSLRTHSSRTGSSHADAASVQTGKKSAAPEYVRAIRVLERAPSALNPVIALHAAIERAQAKDELNIATTLQLAVHVRHAIKRGEREHKMVNQLIGMLDAARSCASPHVPTGI